jgi:hypothetical protein
VRLATSQFGLTLFILLALSILLIFSGLLALSILLTLSGLMINFGSMFRSTLRRDSVIEINSLVLN